ncbi:MAG: hypothetical protein RSD88_07225 [Anaerovoracaceae bacterium]
MLVTVDLKAIGIGLIIIGLIVLIIFVIILLKNLIVTVKHTNKILEDTETISGIASERTKEVNGVVGKLIEAVSSVSDIIKGNQSTVGALTAIAKAAMSLKNLLQKEKKEE